MSRLPLATMSVVEASARQWNYGWPCGDRDEYEEEEITERKREAMEVSRGQRDETYREKKIKSFVFAKLGSHHFFLLFAGEYLALTGEKLNGVEMVACGLATHYSLNARLPGIDERLGNLMTDDTSVIEKSLAHYGDLVYLDKRSVLHKIERIDECFSHDTIEEIIHALENEAVESYDEWCTTALKKLKEASPLSLKVTLQSIREGRYQPLDQCLAREYRMSLNCMSKQVSNDFCEGVRARFVDEDFAPKWDPPTLGDVTKDMVDAYFAPISEVDSELNLPTALREPSV
ncbi:hypothetical protein RJ639_030620 [Escallonia herrerae]|uniref:3-hydroxyisobutyryl-CoA hydrolase n=1 Tax=Escallonia herrerae TaxID=1293975 RepID=A0AA88X110_9ASTE|nr:hypothetical protein RJ639_030620 [Escallonia herrerae]